ncbi:MAG: hypothetical protein IKR17_04725 [Bacteroidales bacterium]|nr:hypothetical protein [Bacteroidales bacterium]
MAKKKISNSYKSIAQRALCIIGGMAVGTAIKNTIGKKSVNGTDLLGMDGATSAYTTPAIVAAAGLAGMTMAKNQMLKDAALGMLATGGAGIINAATGKSLVSLGDTEDQPVVPLLPGIGDPIEYDQLPSDNELQTTYSPQYEADNGLPDEVGALEDCL